MGLLITKLAIALLQPLSVVLLLMLASIALGARRKPRAARALLALAALMLWLSATPVTSWRLRRPIESRFPPRPIEELPAADVLLVLGGGIEPAVSPRLRPEVNLAGDRALYAAALYRAGKAPRVLVSGGAFPWQNEPADAHGTQQLLEDLGVPARAITLEPNSRSTRENCVETRALLGEAPARVLLVTSALHMPRALAACRAVGLDVTPATTDIEVLHDAGSGILYWLPDSESLDATSRAIREIAATAAYRARGWLAPEPSGAERAKPGGATP